jgi:hypothetical protein
MLQDWQTYERETREDLTNLKMRQAVGLLVGRLVNKNIMNGF